MITNRSSAFNAIISSSVVMLDIAYGIPIAVNCIRGRTMLPERSFVLPNTLGWIANIVRPARIIKAGPLAHTNYRYLLPTSVSRLCYSSSLQCFLRPVAV